MLPKYNTFVATKLLIIVLLALVVMFQFIAAIGGGLILQKFENYKNLTFEDDQGNFTDDGKVQIHVKLSIVLLRGLVY